MKRTRLLIVEEHSAVRTALARRLGASAAIEVVAAVAELAEAEAAVVAGTVDKIVVGVSRACGSGLEALKHAVARLYARGVVVVVLASYADDVEREELAAAGASHYLLKQLGSDELIAEILGAVTDGAIISAL
ncbi:MAG: response regulator [Candidatus Promineifilaceae bacterium]|nr:response regulator [Candidatus Promineifilaceae bacterium]